MIRGPRNQTSSPDPSGILEIHIVDDDASRYADTGPDQRHGSLYRYAAAERAPMRPAGQWSAHEVVVTRDQLLVTVNGTPV